MIMINAHTHNTFVFSVLPLVPEKSKASLADLRDCLELFPMLPNGNRCIFEVMMIRQVFEITAVPRTRKNRIAQTIILVMTFTVFQYLFSSSLWEPSFAVVRNISHGFVDLKKRKLNFLHVG